MKYLKIISIVLIFSLITTSTVFPQENTVLSHQNLAPNSTFVPKDLANSILEGLEGGSGLYDIPSGYGELEKGVKEYKSLVKAKWIWGLLRYTAPFATIALFLVASYLSFYFMLFVSGSAFFAGTITFLMSILMLKIFLYVNKYVYGKILDIERDKPLAYKKMDEQQFEMIKYEQRNTGKSDDIEYAFENGGTAFGHVIVWFYYIMTSIEYIGDEKGDNRITDAMLATTKDVIIRKSRGKYEKIDSRIWNGILKGLEEYLRKQIGEEELEPDERMDILCDAMRYEQIQDGLDTSVSAKEKGYKDIYTMREWAIVGSCREEEDYIDGLVDKFEMLPLEEQKEVIEGVNEEMLNPENGFCGFNFLLQIANMQDEQLQKIALDRLQVLLGIDEGLGFLEQKRVGEFKKDFSLPGVHYKRSNGGFQYSNLERMMKDVSKEKERIDSGVGKKKKKYMFYIALHYLLAISVSIGVAIKNSLFSIELMGLFVVSTEGALLLLFIIQWFAALYILIERYVEARDEFNNEYKEKDWRSKLEDKIKVFDNYLSGRVGAMGDGFEYEIKDIVSSIPLTRGAICELYFLAESIDYLFNDRELREEGNRHSESIRNFADRMAKEIGGDIDLSVLRGVFKEMSKSKSFYPDKRAELMKKRIESTMETLPSIHRSKLIEKFVLSRLMDVRDEFDQIEVIEEELLDKFKSFSVGECAEVLKRTSDIILCPHVAFGRLFLLLEMINVLSAHAVREDLALDKIYELWTDVEKNTESLAVKYLAKRKIAETDKLRHALRGEERVIEFVYDATRHLHKFEVGISLRGRVTAVSRDGERFRSYNETIWKRAQRIENVLKRVSGTEELKVYVVLGERHLGSQSNLNQNNFRNCGYYDGHVVVTEELLEALLSIRGENASERCLEFLFRYCLTQREFPEEGYASLLERINDPIGAAIFNTVLSQVNRQPSEKKRGMIARFTRNLKVKGAVVLGRHIDIGNDEERVRSEKLESMIRRCISFGSLYVSSDNDVLVRCRDRLDYYLRDIQVYQTDIGDIYSSFINMGVSGTLSGLEGLCGTRDVLSISELFSLGLEVMELRFYEVLCLMDAQVTSTEFNKLLRDMGMEKRDEDSNSQNGDGVVSELGVVEQGSSV